jgi:hypothetical protein
MEKCMTAILVFTAFLTTETAYAESGGPLGKAYFATQWAHIGFIDSLLDKFDVDNEVYAGL